MSISETKNIILTALCTVLLCLGGWVMTIHARTAVLEEKAIRNDKDRVELKQIIRENTRVIMSLKDYLINKGE